MKLKILTALAVLATGVTAFGAQISGEISFDGTITFNTADIASATVITSFSNERVSAGTQMGNYSAVPDNTAVAFAEPINFAAFVGPVNNFYTFTLGPTTYSFDLSTLSIVFQGPGFLNLYGTGTANITGFDATPGFFRITAQEGINRFSFSASQGNPVPEGGATVLLLGLALTAIGCARRKLA
jgi:hypothetical protein